MKFYEFLLSTLPGCVEFKAQYKRNIMYGVKHFTIKKTPGAKSKVNPIWKAFILSPLSAYEAKPSPWNTLSIYLTPILLHSSTRPHSHKLTRNQIEDIPLSFPAFWHTFAHWHTTNLMVNCVCNVWTAVGDSPLGCGEVAGSFFSRISSPLCSLASWHWSNLG